MDKNTFALNPPMGWNSWDCYGAGVTENILRQNADYMAEHLKQYGWEYIVCDIQWYEPQADSSHYRKFADLCMDEYGRLIPAPNRFPSAADGNGFGPIADYIVCDIQWYEPLADSSHYRKFADLCMDEYGRLIPAPNRFPSAADGNGFGPIADYIHEKGLKFGIHIMRGIPRQAVYQNTRVKGCSYTARDVAHSASICAWNTDMYGVDATKPGAQEYYDSILELYASWGVDFIKVDDICVKYNQINDDSVMFYGGDEIELIRNAIDKTGRPIVLSLSPGPAMVEQAEHLRKNANMWRITNDLWDDWNNIMEMFTRCDNWSPFVSEGCFPDCDMLPIGHLSIIGCERGLSDRQTRLSHAEIRTMFTLWCLFRSPMMLGCELTDLDEWTKELLSNTRVLDLLKKSRHARQVMRNVDLVVWQAEDEEGNQYAAMFNVANWEDDFALSLKKLGLSGTYSVSDLWSGEELGETDNAITASVKAHDAKLYRLCPAGK